MNCKYKIAYLFYDNRSGSTLLASLLDNFDEIGVSLESISVLDILTKREEYKSVQQINDIVKYLYSEAKFRNWGLDKDNLLNELNRSLPISNVEIFEKIFAIYFKINKSKAKKYIFKVGSPLYLNIILKWYNNPKIIYIYRDGRAVYCSKKRSRQSDNLDILMAVNPIHAANLWCRSNNYIEKSKGKIKLITVKYEDLVKCTKYEMSKVYKSLISSNKYKKYEGEFTTCSNSYKEKIPVKQRHLHSNIGKKPMTSRIDSWKNDIKFEECYLYEMYARKQLLKYGYELIIFGKNIKLIQKFKIVKNYFAFNIEYLNNFFKKIIFYISSPNDLKRKLYTIKK